MSKAWELIKHLEEGGEVYHKFDEESYSMNYISNWDDIHVNPSDYKIVKPLVKYSVEVWAPAGISKGSKGLGFFELSGLSKWNYIETKECSTKYHITVEQIEGDGGE